MPVEALASRALEGLTIGAAIKVLREHRTGLSARQLSMASGLSPAYVNKLEKGEIEPSFRAFARLARELSMTQQEVYLLLRAEGER